MLVPRRAYLTAGRGAHPAPLVAFELALRDAGIAAQNLVTVSSILPPSCPLVPREEGEGLLQAGQILHVVMSRVSSNDPGQAPAAAIGVAVPTDAGRHGFVAEHSLLGGDEATLRAHAEDLATTMLATTLGVDLDPSVSAEEHAAQLVRSGQLAETRSVAAAMEPPADGGTHCVVAACVFLMDWMIASP